MSEQKLTLKQAWLATWHFLIGLWNQNPKKFAAKGIGLGAYLDFVDWGYTQDIDWREACYETILMPWCEQNTVSSEQLLTIIQLLLKKASKKYGFKLLEVSVSIEDLRNNQESINQQLLLWNESIMHGILGDRMPSVYHSYWEWQNQNN